MSQPRLRSGVTVRYRLNRKTGRVSPHVTQRWGQKRKTKPRVSTKATIMPGVNSTGLWTSSRWHELQCMILELFFGVAVEFIFAVVIQRLPIGMHSLEDDHRW